MNPYDIQPHPTIQGLAQASYGGGPPITVQPPPGWVPPPRMGTTTVEAPKAQGPDAGSFVKAMAYMNPITAPFAATYDAAKALVGNQKPTEPTDESSNARIETLSCGQGLNSSLMGSWPAGSSLLTVGFCDACSCHATD